MKFMPVLLLLLSSSFVFAQVQTTAYFTDKVSDGKENYLSYKPEKLTWNHFNGTPPPPSRIGAETMTGFGYRSNLKAMGNKGIMQVEVFCFMDPDQSWVRPDKKSDYILNHEQRHFDITFIHAARFLQESKNLNAAALTANKAIAELYKKISKELGDMQTAYDSETAHGQLPTVQANWDAKISKLLGH